VHRALPIATPTMRTYAQPSVRVHFSHKERITLTKRLAMLLRSGMAITDCLVLLRDQSRTSSQVAFFSALVTQVSSGQSLANALTPYQTSLGVFMINVIRIGEQSGTLAENLEYISSEHKKQYELRRQIIGALLYPAIIVAATFLITIFLIVYIFPKIVPIFTSLDLTLPLSTRILMSVSQFLSDYGLWLLIVVCVVGVGYTLIRAWPKVAWVTDTCTFKLPLIGTLSQYYQTATLCRTVGLLLRNEVPMAISLQSVIASTRHMLYLEVLLSIQEEVMKGKTLSSQLERYPKLFPALCTQMIQSGEKTGNLSQTLIYVSEVYESEIKEYTKNLTTMLEPVLMLVMGLCVGFVAISIITPIYSITSNLHG
jgi:type II secretory pathway component PulF